MHALELHLNPETTEVLAPEEFGFEHHHGQLIPATSWKALNPLCAGDAFKRIHTVFPQLKFDRNWTNMHV